MDLDMAFHLIAKSVVTENIPGYDISVEESRPCVCVCVCCVHHAAELLDGTIALWKAQSYLAKYLHK